MARPKMPKGEQPKKLSSVGTKIQKDFKVYTPNNPLIYQSDNRQSSNKWQGLTDKPLQNRNTVFS